VGVNFSYVGTFFPMDWCGGTGELLKNAYLGPRVMLEGALIEGTLGLEWAG
jgi:hypothetical protein